MWFMLLGSEVRTTGETSRINTSGTGGPPLILRSFSDNNRNIVQEGGGLYVVLCCDSPSTVMFPFRPRTPVEDTFLWRCQSVVDIISPSSLALERPGRGQSDGGVRLDKKNNK